VVGENLLRSFQGALLKGNSTIGACCFTMHGTNSLLQLLLVDGVVIIFMCYPKAHLVVPFMTELYATGKTDLPPELSVSACFASCVPYVACPQWLLRRELH